MNGNLNRREPSFEPTPIYGTSPLLDFEVLYRSFNFLVWGSQMILLAETGTFPNQTWLVGFVIFSGKTTPSGTSISVSATP